MTYLKLFEDVSTAIQAKDVISPNVTFIEEGNRLLNKDCGLDIPLEIVKEGERVFFREKSSGPEMVDLGLTDQQGHKILWAKCNIGATSETGDGKYFAWGDVEGFEASEASGKFSEAWYVTRPGHAVNSDIADDDSVHNAAFAAYGAGYTLPDKYDFNVLVNGTKDNPGTGWVTNYNGSGVNGYKFVGTNNNVLFIPASGYCYNGSKYTDATAQWGSSFFSTEMAYFLFFNDSEAIVDGNVRYNGVTIRAIKRVQ